MQRFHSLGFLRGYGLMRIATTLLAGAIMSVSVLGGESLPPLKDAKAPRNLQELWGKYDPAKEPVGVVAAITPFNAPFNLAAHKIAPSIAAGNTLVLKPPPQAPLSHVCPLVPHGWPVP